MLPKETRSFGNVEITNWELLAAWEELTGRYATEDEECFFTNLANNKAENVNRE